MSISASTCMWLKAACSALVMPCQGSTEFALRAKESGHDQRRTRCLYGEHYQTRGRRAGRSFVPRADRRGWSCCQQRFATWARRSTVRIAKCDWGHRVTWRAACLWARDCRVLSPWLVPLLQYRIACVAVPAARDQKPRWFVDRNLARGAESVALDDRKAGARVRCLERCRQLRRAAIRIGLSHLGCGT